MPVRLTAAACQKIVTLARQDGRTDAGLRITVEPGGCCGLFYYMSIDVPQPRDVVIAQAGARLLLSPETARDLEGAKIAYGERLNPRVSATTSSTGSEPPHEASVN